MNSHQPELQRHASAESAGRPTRKSSSRRSWRGWRALADDKRGNVAMIFAAMVVPSVALIGSSVDFGRAISERTKLQSITDTAALAAGREYQTSGNVDTAMARAIAFVSAATAHGFKGAITFGPGDVSIDTDTNLINVKATSHIDTTFLAVLGSQFNSLQVNARTQAGLAQGGVDKHLEVSIMMDVTGSMGGTKIDDLKLAAKDIVQILVREDQTEWTSRIALVPFSQAVNVGPYFEAVTGVVNGDNTYNYPPNCYNNKGRLKNSCKNDPQYFNPEYAVCVVERVANRFHDHTPETGEGNKFPLYDLKKQNAGLQNSSCKPSDASIIPLTNDKLTLNDAIDDLVPSGMTAGHLGTAWAWYMLSPNWSNIWPVDSEPRAYDDEEVMKIAILMTDGAYNTAYETQTNGNSNTQAEALCDNMKAEGITVYTVGFQLSNSAKQIMKDCATTEEHHFFDTGSGSELRMAFREIGFRLAQLRLTQ